MKKLFIIIIILVLYSVIVSAKLSDETLKEVEKLKTKYHISCLDITGSEHLYYTNSEANFVYEYTYFWFEDGKFFVETQDGKWYIEMKKVKKGDEIIEQ